MSGAIALPPATAQSISVDDTISPNPRVLAGPNYLIPQADGRVSGANLFHSFGQFNLNTGERVTFQSAPDVRNIFSRVTGGTPSSINGQINSTASVYLLNPNGIILGANASLNVGGSFVATTANAIQFGDRGFFSASNPTDPALLNIDPSAFLFNQLTGNLESNAARLRVPSGETLMLLGGDVNINGGRLNAWGGRVAIGGLASAGRVLLNNDYSLSFPTNIERADISLSDLVVDVTLDTSGDVEITGRNIRVTDSRIRAGIEVNFGLPGSQAGDLIVNATNEIRVEGNSRLENDVNTNSIGNGGRLVISTGSLVLGEGSELSSSTFGRGNAGGVVVEARDRVTLNGGDIFSSVGEGGIGQGGTMRLSTNTLDLMSGAQISASTFGQGNAGNVTIEVGDRASMDGISADERFVSGIFSSVDRAGNGSGGTIRLSTNTLSLTNGAELVASTFGQGNAGDVFVTARDRITLDGSSPGGRFLTGIFSSLEQNANGQGGTINLLTNTLSLTNGAQLVASTFGRGEAGDVIVEASDRILLDGASANGRFPTGIFSSIEDAGNGQGGTINLSTNVLSLTNGAQLSARTFGQGSAGDVFVEARDRIILDGTASGGQFLSGVFSTVGERANGRGGTINLSTNVLSITNGARLIASTFGQGNAGSVIVEAGDRITLDGASRNGQFRSGILSSVEGTGRGQGGIIRLSTNTLSLTNGARMTAETSGQGNAGDMILDVRDRISLNNASILSDVNPTGNGRGGTIRLITDALSLTNGARLTARTYGQGSAGNLLVEADDHISLESNAFIISNVEETGQGQGGTIRLVTPILSLTNRAGLSAGTFGQGNAGDVIVQARDRISLNHSNIFSRVNRPGTGRGGTIRLTTDTLSLSNNAQLLADTSGQGNAGNVLISASDRIALNNSFIFSDVERTGNGRGGTIRLTTDRLSLSNNSQLQADTSGQGDAGSVLISVGDRISLDNSDILSDVEPTGNGRGGTIRLTTGTLSLTNGAQLLANTAGQGNAGNVVVTARETVLLDASSRQNGVSSGFFTTTERDAGGRGGSIAVTTDALQISRGAIINAETLSRFQGGDVVINANTLVLSEGGQIITTALNQGRAGNMTLNARHLSLRGTDPNYATRVRRFRDAVSNQGAASGLFANTIRNSTGQGGTIRISTNQLEVEGQARVEVNSLGSGAAGDIRIQAASVRLANGGRLVADTQTVDGGSIFLSGLDQLVLRDRSSISTNAGTTGAGGDGGNIAVDADFIVAIPTENSDITANAFQGNGGRVDVTTQGLFGIAPRPFITPLSDITASSERGIQGTVAIATPDVDPSRGLADLPTDIADVTQQIAQNCSDQGSNASGTSEFVITGRGGLPPNPNELLGSGDVLTSFVSVDDPTETSDRPSSRSEAIPPSPLPIEAQGWVTGADGAVTLVAQAPHSVAIAPVACSR